MTLAKEKNMTLKDISLALGYSDRHISNSCNKDSSILSNNLIHKISMVLDCSLDDLSRGI